jgi:hypothetical protein
MMYEKFKCIHCDRPKFELSWLLLTFENLSTIIAWSRCLLMIFIESENRKYKSFKNTLKSVSMWNLKTYCKFENDNTSNYQLCIYLFLFYIYITFCISSYRICDISLELRNNIEMLKQNNLKKITTMVNLGSHFYVKTKMYFYFSILFLNLFQRSESLLFSSYSPDATRIYVNVGLGFHVEFTLDEALKFIEVKEKYLNKSAFFSNSFFDQRNSESVRVVSQLFSLICSVLSKNWPRKSIEFVHKSIICTKESKH